MKKEKSVGTYQRKSKSGKIVTVHAYKAKYDAAEEARKEMAKRAGAGDALLQKKWDNEWDKIESDFIEKHENELGTDEDGNLTPMQQKLDGMLEKFSAKHPTWLGGVVSSKAKTAKKPKVTPTKATTPAGNLGFTADEFKIWANDLDAKEAKRIDKILVKKYGEKAVQKLADEINAGNSRTHKAVFARLTSETKGTKDTLEHSDQMSKKYTGKKPGGGPYKSTKTDLQLPKALIEHLEKQGYHNARLHSSGILSYTYDGEYEQAKGKFTPEDVAYYFGGKKKLSDFSDKDVSKQPVKSAKDKTKVSGTKIGSPIKGGTLYSQGDKMTFHYDGTLNSTQRKNLEKELKASIVSEKDGVYTLKVNKSAKTEKKPSAKTTKVGKGEYQTGMKVTSKDKDSEDDAPLIDSAGKKVSFHRLSPWEEYKLKNDKSAAGLRRYAAYLEGKNKTEKATFAKKYPEGYKVRKNVTTKYTRYIRGGDIQKNFVMAKDGSSAYSIGDDGKLHKASQRELDILTGKLKLRKPKRSEMR